MFSKTSPLVSPCRDLHFILGTPLAALGRKEKLSIWESVNFISKSNTSDFDATFADRIQEISDLKEIYVSAHSHPISKTIVFHLLLHKINTFACDFLQVYQGKSLNLELAQKIYAFAQDLKRHASNRAILWDALSEKHRLFFHHLSGGSEDLQILKKPIYYQWLGDGNMERAMKNDQTVTDFGDGRLFHVFPPMMSEGKETVFPLVHYPNCRLVKPSPDQTQFSSIPLLTPALKLNQAFLGRLGEIFDLGDLEKNIQSEQGESCLSRNQLANVFSCYRSSLCSVLNVPVRLPVMMGRKGEWVVWNHKKENWKDQSLSSSQVQDLFRMMQVEKLWKINVFNDSSFMHDSVPFSLCDDHLFLDGILPLPTFLTVNVQERHQKFIERLNPDLKKELEAFSKEDEEKEEKIAQGLQMLMKKNIISFHDCATLDPQVLLMARLMRLVKKSDLFKFPLKGQLFMQTASPMVSGLISPKNSEGYHFKETKENKGMRLTETILNARSTLRDLIILHIIEHSEKKSSVEELVQHFLEIADEKCEEIAEDLDRQFSQEWSIKEHFMLAFHKEFIEELKCVLEEPCDPYKHLFDKLVLLRESLGDGQQDRKAMNSLLQSVLHEAMVQKYAQAFLADMQPFVL